MSLKRESDKESEEVEDMDPNDMVKEEGAILEPASPVSNINISDEQKPLEGEAVTDVKPDVEVEADCKSEEPISQPKDDDNDTAQDSSSDNKVPGTTPQGILAVKDEDEKKPKIENMDNTSEVDTDSTANLNDFLEQEATGEPSASLLATTSTQEGDKVEYDYCTRPINPNLTTEAYDDSMAVDIKATALKCEAEEKATEIFEREAGTISVVLDAVAEMYDDIMLVDVKPETLECKNDEKVEREDSIKSIVVDAVVETYDDTMAAYTKAETLECKVEEKKPETQSDTNCPEVDMANVDIGSTPSLDVEFPEEEARYPSPSPERTLDSLTPSVEPAEINEQPTNNVEHEVIIIKDEPEEVDAAEALASARPFKRQRLVLEVVVYTFEGFKRRKQEDFEKIKKMKNPKAKKMEALDISLDSIRDRLIPIGLDPFPITLDENLQNTTVSRAFMSSRYGGNTQETFPNIGARHLATHGMNDFMYLNSMYQCRAPQFPGYPGLFFNTDTGGGWSGRHRVFTRLDSGKWLFMGFYETKAALSLTKEEWAQLPSYTRRTWATQIINKGWGGYFRARVVARRELGRKPTKAEWLAVYDSGRYKNSTAEDVAKAFERGDELLAVFTMKCVGYDEAFQRELCEKLQHWVPPPPRKKKGDKPAPAGKNQNAKAKPAKGARKAPAVHDQVGQKRKRANSVESELTEIESEDDADFNEEIFELSDEEEERAYRPRGTKSRPICL
ncbi:hypothetical protein GALMADRAFT_250113 [Galerina marginata CBS 339.88]|uniref:DUF6697 domain-containing protein n=1 Tax=Galerina marginata (strain CBS 339.88) TaxID=685588 RepID=A0A067T2Y7_GALM3|nr:hypothetical protein GALMADRAFT_250113 [Galerina marginata CBS 339.88]